MTSRFVLSTFPSTDCLTQFCSSPTGPPQSWPDGHSNHPPVWISPEDTDHPHSSRPRGASVNKGPRFGRPFLSPSQESTNVLAILEVRKKRTKEKNYSRNQNFSKINSEVFRSLFDWNNPDKRFIFRTHCSKGVHLHWGLTQPLSHTLFWSHDVDQELEKWESH